MDIEQQISRINNMRKQLALLEDELNESCEQIKQQPEFDYPIYMQSKHNKEVVKFTSLTCGVVVVSGNDNDSNAIGHISQKMDNAF